MQATNEQVAKPPSRGSIEALQSPYDRVNSYPHRGTPANTPVYPDTPALRQLRYSFSHVKFNLILLSTIKAIIKPGSFYFNNATNLKYYI